MIKSRAGTDDVAQRAEDVCLELFDATRRYRRCVPIPTIPGRTPSTPSVLDCGACAQVAIPPSASVAAVRNHRRIMNTDAACERSTPGLGH